MLHLFLSFSVVSDVIRWLFIMLTEVAASGHVACDALCFIFLLFPLPVRPCFGTRIFFFHRCSNPLSAAQLCMYAYMHYVCMHVCMYACMCVCMYVHVHVHTCVSHTHTHQEICSFKLTLLAESLAPKFDRYTTHLFVRKITDTMHKLKNNPSIFSPKCIFM